MTRNRIAIAIVSTLAVGFALAAFAGPPSGSNGTVAGTALVEADIPGLEPLLILVTYHADGTITATDKSDFSRGGLTSQKPAAQGIWRRSGPNQTTTVFLFFSLDANGVPNPNSMARSTAVTDWNLGMTEGTGVYTQRVYNPVPARTPSTPTTARLSPARSRSPCES